MAYVLAEAADVARCACGQHVPVDELDRDAWAANGARPSERTPPVVGVLDLDHCPAVSAGVAAALPIHLTLLGDREVEPGRCAAPRQSHRVLLRDQQFVPMRTP